MRFLPDDAKLCKFLQLKNQVYRIIVFESISTQQLTYIWKKHLKQCYRTSNNELKPSSQFFEKRYMQFSNDLRSEDMFFETWPFKLSYQIFLKFSIHKLDIFQWLSFILPNWCKKIRFLIISNWGCVVVFSDCFAFCLTKQNKSKVIQNK